MSEHSTERTFSATPGEVFRFIWQSTRDRRGFFAAMFFVVSAASVCFVFVPIETKRLIDVITTQQPSPESALTIAKIILLMVGLRLFGGLFYRSSGYMSSRLVPRIMAQLEETGLRGILAQTQAFFTDQHTGSLVRRIGRLSDAYNRVHSTFYWNILGALAVTTTIVVELLLTRPAAAGLIVVWIILIAIGNMFITKWKTPADQERSRAQSAAQGLLADIVSNAATVKLFAQEAPESRAFHRGLQERVNAETVAWNRSEHGLTGTDVASALLNGGLLFFALWWWEKGQVTVGDFVLLQSFVVMLVDQLMFIGFAYRDMIEALANASEIVGILKSQVDIRDVKGAKPLRVPTGSIEFSHMTFGYGDTRVLSDFSLAIAPQEKIALIGPSGAGKSTVVKLLLHFYEARDGKIRIDGQDISKVTQQSLRAQISLVPQDPSLFHRSLKENIAYGRSNVSLKDVIQAAKKAHCHDFIAKLPQGYDTLVGERGVKLSGGERQRIAIARAILADTPILILDEATSSLDSESEQLIQQALKTLMKNKTVIVIAHRLSTVMGMDRIVVMEHGRLADTGTHDELFTKIGTYQKLWNIQVGGFQAEYAPK